VRTKSVLYLRNLETGEEYPVYDNLSKDQQEAWTVFGSFTGFSWTPDDKHIIIWSNGKINKIDISKPNAAVEIPFTANVKQKIADVVRFKQNINPDVFNVNVIVFAGITDVFASIRRVEGNAFNLILFLLRIFFFFGLHFLKLHPS
jgi:hypothetical protein